MPTIALYNLGCSKNLIDGDRIVHLFKEAGYDYIHDYYKANVIVVNTCAFIQAAQEEAIDSILDAAEFRKKGVCSKLIVSGCFSQRFRETVAPQFPEVDMWIGTEDWQTMLPHYLSTTISPYQRVLPEPVATQYQKIAQGCSHRCTFCIIPIIHGNFRSKSVSEILEEALWLYSMGVRELILVAQDTSFYGKDIGTTLHYLLEQLLAKTAFPWIRLMYLHPQHVTSELLALVAHEKRICSYFDIPLQHIADPVLRAMNRMPLSNDIYGLVENIRSTVPDAAIRTSFILGFPGETEKHFEQLLRFIEHARFDKAGVFPYSAEEGTKAFDMRPKPRNATTQRRCETLMTLQREISREQLEKKIGSDLEVIIERVSDDPDFNFDARSQYDAPEVDGKVLLNSGSFDPGSIVKVKIIGTGDYDLFAEPDEKKEER